MKLVITLFCLLFLPVQSTWAACGNDEACLHNVIRDALSFGQTLTNLGPNLNQAYDFGLQNRPANPLPPLNNSNNLRSSAASHARQCTFSHSGISGVGENLFVGTGNAWTLINAINSWADEARYLSYPKNAASVSCAAGKVCGHYTQMIWETTTNVGCAVQYCAHGISGFSNTPSTNIVCQYSLPGNYVNHIGGPILAPYAGLGVISTDSIQAITQIIQLLLLSE